MSRTFATPRGAVSIREARTEDADRFRELRLSALQDSPTAFGADHQTDAAQPPAFWRERVASDKYRSLHLAEIENTLIGMAGILRNRSAKTAHNAWIWGVYVTPEWRGLRIAEELIKSCIAWATKSGIIIIKLGVSAANESAVRCYERCGFTVYGTEPRAIHYEGRYYDEYLMSRPLDAP